MGQEIGWGVRSDRTGATRGVACARRDENIDTIRGIACLLLVSYHVVGSSGSSGMRVPDGSGLRLANDVLAYVRMPLFTFVSGVVYAAKPVSLAGAGHFLKGKATRLLAPLAFVGLLFALAQRAVPGTNFDMDPAALPDILIFPYAHFWFLQALFLVFLAVCFLEVVGALRSRHATAGVFCASCTLFIFRHELPSFFAIDRAAYLLPMFIAGLAVTRFSSARQLWVAIELATGALLVAFAASMLGYPGMDHALALCLAIIVPTLLLHHCPPSHALAIVGAYSYSIYLHHVFGTAGSRIVLGQLGVANDAAVFALGLAAGIALPIAMHELLAPVPVVSRALLGIRHRSRASAVVRSRPPVGSVSIT